MSPMECFGAYAAAFEVAFLDDDWSKVAPYFAEDAVYEIHADPPLGGRHVGREGIMTYFKANLDGFDRRFATRALGIVRGPEMRGDDVWLHWWVEYTAPGVPPLRFEGEETATVADERIVRLADHYRDDQVAVIKAYIDTHGSALGLA